MSNTLKIDRLIPWEDIKEVKVENHSAEELLEKLVIVIVNTDMFYLDLWLSQVEKLSMELKIKLPLVLLVSNQSHDHIQMLVDNKNIEVHMLEVGDDFPTTANHIAPLIKLAESNLLTMYEKRSVLFISQRVGTHLIDLRPLSETLDKDRKFFFEVTTKAARGGNIPVLLAKQQGANSTFYTTGNMWMDTSVCSNVQEIFSDDFQRIALKVEASSVDCNINKVVMSIFQLLVQFTDGLTEGEIIERLNADQKEVKEKLKKLKKGTKVIKIDGDKYIVPSALGFIHQSSSGTTSGTTEMVLGKTKKERREKKEAEKMERMAKVGEARKIKEESDNIQRLLVRHVIDCIEEGARDSFREAQKLLADAKRELRGKRDADWQQCEM